MKHAIWLIMLLFILTFTACSDNGTMSMGSGSPPPRAEITPSKPAESSTAPNTEESEPADIAVSNDPTENPAPPPDTPAPLQTPDNTGGSNTPKPSNPPTSLPTTSQPATPAPTPPSATNNPPPSTPSTPPPVTTPTAPPTPAKPVYTAADYEAIKKVIKEYGEAKGFQWDNTFYFGQKGVGYCDRPNLQRDGIDGVIGMLKYNCDTIETYYGKCDFYVFQQEYEGNTEFIVLYR